MADISNLIAKYGSHFSAFLSQRLKEIDNEIQIVTAPLQAEKAEINFLLKEISKGNSGTHGKEVNGEAYSTSMSTIEKAVYFTKKNGYMTLSEIASKISEKEPASEMDIVKSTLSAVLAMEMKKEEPRLVRKPNESNKWVYKAK
jgi:hypothetical protein